MITVRVAQNNRESTMQVLKSCMACPKWTIESSNNILASFIGPKGRSRFFSSKRMCDISSNKWDGFKQLEILIIIVRVLQNWDSAADVKIWHGTCPISGLKRFQTTHCISFIGPKGRPRLCSVVPSLHPIPFWSSKPNFRQYLYLYNFLSSKMSVPGFWHLNLDDLLFHYWCCLHRLVGWFLRYSTARSGGSGTNLIEKSSVPFWNRKYLFMFKSFTC